MSKVEPQEMSAEDLAKVCAEYPSVKAHIAHLEQRLATLENVHRQFLKQVRNAGVSVDLYSMALQKDLRNERAEDAEQEAERYSKLVDHLFNFHHCNCDLEPLTPKKEQP